MTPDTDPSGLKIISSSDSKITLSDKECAIIGVAGNLRCGHGYQVTKCKIEVILDDGEPKTQVDDEHCNNINGTSLSVTENQKFCIQAEGATDTECFITSW